MTITYVSGNQLYVNLTNRCSNRCEFCLRESTDRVGDSGSLWLDREPTREEILEDIGKRDLSKYRELVFCGFGEPFYRADDIAWIAAEVRKASSIPMRINTNGQGDLINGRPTLPALQGLIDTVSISLNEPTAEEYQKVCHCEFGGEAAFSAILKFARDAREYIPHVIFSVVDVMPKEKIEQCRRIAEECGVKFRVREYIP